MPLPFSFWKNSAAAPPDGPPALLSGLLAHWKLNEEIGVRYDSTANGYDLTDNNDVGYAAGKLGNAAYFDGTNCLSCATNLFAEKSGLTVAFWLKSSGPDTWLILGGSGEIPTLVGTNGSEIDYIPTGGGENISTVCVLDGEWHFVACVYDGAAGTSKNYKDGSLDTTLTGLDSSTPDSGAGTIISATQYPYVGSLDSVSVWYRALTDAEVAALYNSGDGLDFESFTL